MTFAASIGDELTDFFGDAIMVVVKMLIFLAIMAVGWFVARWLYRWASTMLTRVGLDRAVDRGGLRRVMGGWSASDLTPGSCSTPCCSSRCSSRSGCSARTRSRT
ncbi:hypothetical protein ACFQX7_25435 [Luedemannella flava]